MSRATGSKRMFRESTRRTPKRRSNYDPEAADYDQEKADWFEAANLAAWASRQQDPQTVTDVTDLARALDADSKRNHWQC